MQPINQPNHRTVCDHVEMVPWLHAIFLCGTLGRFITQQMRAWRKLLHKQSVIHVKWASNLFTTYNRMPSTSVLANRKWYTGGAKGKVIPKLNLKIACMRPLEKIQPSHQIQSRLHASSAKRCIRYLKSTQKYMKVSSAVTPNKNWSSFTVLFHNQVCVRPICTCSSSLRPTALNISPSCWLLRFGRGPSGIKFTMWNKTYANNKLQSQIVTLIINLKKNRLETRPTIHVRNPRIQIKEIQF